MHRTQFDSSLTNANNYTSHLTTFQKDKMLNISITPASSLSVPSSHLLSLPPSPILGNHCLISINIMLAPLVPRFHAYGNI